MIHAIIRRWTGEFDNHRQVEAHIARGEPVAPELTREHRQMVVHQLDAPQLGEQVLFFEEMRESVPGLAHRQRVVVLVEDPERGCPRAQQMFFRSGPAYDRPPLDPAAVARMAADEFRHVACCDLFFHYEERHDRYRASMLPGACRYQHPVDGPVYAEFDMLLHRNQLWYRDRSIRVADGSVRGEIDGFSWLLFDRVAPPPLPPALARQQGVWKGIWRSYGPDGTLRESFDAVLISRFIATDGKLIFQQTNHYPNRGDSPQTIESSGEVRDGRICFSNPRLKGWSQPLADDPTGRSSVLMIHFNDGSSLQEIVTNSEDGLRRHRSAQVIKDGHIVRRTLIDEEKITDDWQSYQLDT